MNDEIFTSQDNKVPHRHLVEELGELSALEKVQGEQLVVQILTGATFEQKQRPTRCYNCYGLAFSNSHGWVTGPEVAIADDFTGVTGAPRKDDVVLYLKDALLTHSAVVVKAEIGETVEVRSKWGECDELIHPIDRVPQEYGKPALFLRRVGHVKAPNSPCPEVETVTPVNEATKAEAPAALLEARPPAPPASPLEAAGDIGAERMLASSPEVRDRIIRERAGMRPASTRPASNFSSLTDAASAEGAPPSAAVEVDQPEEKVDQDAINELLDALQKPEVYSRLMLASTTAVERKIIATLAPVRQLTEMADVENPAPVKAAIGASALRLFLDRQDAKNYDKLASILLSLLKSFPVKEAAVPLAQYLLNRRPVGLARNLAVEAFSAAVLS